MFWPCVFVAAVAWLLYRMYFHHLPAEPAARDITKIRIFGDSIADNRPYAGTKGSLPQILATLAPHITVESWARDGDVIAHIDAQVADVATDEDALAVVTIGGNDCLGLLNRLDWFAVPAILHFLWTFGDRYERALQLVQDRHGEVVALSIYSMNSSGGVLLEPGVLLVNWIMARRAHKLGIRVIDIHALFTHSSDYALIRFPEYARVIEPSGRGAYKIACAILEDRLRISVHPRYTAHRESRNLFIPAPLE